MWKFSMILLKIYNTKYKWVIIFEIVGKTLKNKSFLVNGYAVFIKVEIMAK